MAGCLPRVALDLRRPVEVTDRFERNEDLSQESESDNTADAPVPSVDAGAKRDFSCSIE